MWKTALLLLILSGVFAAVWGLRHQGDRAAGIPPARQIDVYFCLSALCSTASTVLFVLAVLGASGRGEEHIPSEALPVQEEVLPELVDYVELSRSGEAYEGKEVLVAGRISGFPDDRSFKFCERLSRRGDIPYVRVGFEWKPAMDPVATLFEKGQYVLVQGRWSNIFGLSGAKVLATDEEAQEAAGPFLEQWEKEKRDCAETLPVTDYEDILKAPEAFEGQMVRVAGIVSSAGKNALNSDVFFSFAGRERSELGKGSLTVRLRGCPREMQELCGEGEAVLLSGRCDGESLNECYVEAVGEEAEAVIREQNAMWLETYRLEREEFIASCQPWVYDDLMRWPIKNQGLPAAVRGRVLKRLYVAPVKILLETEKGEVFSVLFSGPRRQEPVLLEGDEVTFYGTYDGVTYDYEEEYGCVPQIAARYSSITEWYEETGGTEE